MQPQSSAEIREALCIEDIGLVAFPQFDFMGFLAIVLIIVSKINFAAPWPNSWTLRRVPVAQSLPVCQRINHVNQINRLIN
jgi:hypothetical protein